MIASEGSGKGEQNVIVKIGKSQLELVQGDITEQDVEVIVNAANTALQGGGGVDGAIQRAGGKAIREEGIAVGPCQTGFAKITGAGDLKADWVIHAVGPVYHNGRNGEPEKLAGCYRRSMELAAEKGLTVPQIALAFNVNQPLNVFFAFHYENRLV